MLLLTKNVKKYFSIYLLFLLFVLQFGQLPGLNILISERNYPAHKLDILALKWAVMGCFHECFCGGTFDVFTDKSPQTYILTSAKLCCNRKILDILILYIYFIYIMGIAYKVYQCYGDL